MAALKALAVNYNSSSSSSSEDEEEEVTFLSYARREPKVQSDPESDTDSDSGDDNSSIVSQQRRTTDKIQKNILCTKGELQLSDLAPVVHPTTAVAPHLCREHGEITGIVDTLVVVLSNRGAPALNEDTVVYREGGIPLGAIFEVFGHVDQPHYTVRFNSNKEIQDREITISEKVYFAPNSPDTLYIFLASLNTKGSDASWEHNNEPPANQLDYSDDEEERKAKKKSGTTGSSPHATSNGRHARRLAKPRRRFCSRNVPSFNANAPLQPPVFTPPYVSHTSFGPGSYPPPPHWNASIPFQMPWNPAASSTSQQDAAFPSTSQWTAPVPSTSQWNPAVPSTSQWNPAVPSTSQWNHAVPSSSQWSTTLPTVYNFGDTNQANCWYQTGIETPSLNHQPPNDTP